MLHIKISSLQPRWDLIYNKVNRFFFSFKSSENHSILDSNWNPSLTKTGSLPVSQQVGCLLKLAQALPDGKQTWIFWRSAFKLPHKDLPKWKGERKEGIEKKDGKDEKFSVLSNPPSGSSKSTRWQMWTNCDSELWRRCVYSLRITQKGVSKPCANNCAEPISASHSCMPA